MGLFSKRNKVTIDSAEDVMAWFVNNVNADAPMSKDELQLVQIVILWDIFRLLRER